MIRDRSDSDTLSITQNLLADRKPSYISAGVRSAPQADCRASLLSAFDPKPTFTDCFDLTVIGDNFENARKTLWTEYELRFAELTIEGTL
jgi:hypothetical protein